MAMNEGVCSNSSASRWRSSIARRDTSTCSVVSVHTTSTPPTPLATLSSSIGL
jgi:hypothetical protein